MNLHTCTIVLNNQLKLTSSSVDQSLGFIDQYGHSSIEKVLIDASENGQIHSFHHLSLEESIESLMDL
ncbi:hypothetical protein [Vibrio sonorensis]|uniref:hypothetical protein n=1 Tax=Vibrio sonorensis TaxID=1004316 RepID=UPI0008DB3267|nr:hypothetical protein [Vibrio sonorensis]